MWLRHLGNLVGRSWLVMVKATSTNTLGFIVWTVVLTALVWFATVVQKFVELRAEKVPRPFYAAIAQSARAGFYECGAVVVLTVLVWAVACVATVYQDHITLVAQNQALQNELTRRKTKGLSLKIGGLILTGHLDSTRIQATVTAFNDGDPTTAHNWSMKIESSNGTLSSYHAIGEPLAKGSLDLPRLNVVLQQPIITNAEIPGLLSFVFPHVAHSVIEKLRHDPEAIIVLSVLDDSGHEVKTERRFMDLAAERFEHHPPK